MIPSSAQLNREWRDMPHAYRKKPVIVQAAHLTEDNILKVASWCHGDPMDDSENIRGYTHINIYTKEGVMRADIGDYVIRGVAGEFYPCKPDIFAQTYESVEDLEDERSVLDAKTEETVPWSDVKKEAGIE